jgi:hypothetical protein
MYGCSKEVGRKDVDRKEVRRCSSTPTRAREPSGASRGRLPRQRGRDHTRGVIPGSTREGWAEEE